MSYIALNAALQFFECVKYLNQVMISGFLIDGNPFWTRGRKANDQRHSKIFIARGHPLAGIGTSTRRRHSREFSSAKTISPSVNLHLRLEAVLWFMNGPHGFYSFTEGKTFDYQIDSFQTRTKTGPKLEEVRICETSGFSRSFYVVVISGVQIHK